MLLVGFRVDVSERQTRCRSIQAYVLQDAAKYRPMPCQIIRQILVVGLLASRPGGA